MLGILCLPILCFIIVGGSYAALKPINFYTPRDQDDSLEQVVFNFRDYS
ncbi:hypothetical protein [Bacillus sp. KH172YL63]|nr:hypothetical protein [Bacillus sp. KH172YL63]BCB02827.1 hypothetical protein KH172YL63_09600 [Bacillus sp. KH172YL63]